MQGTKSISRASVVGDFWQTGEESLPKLDLTASSQARQLTSRQNALLVLASFSSLSLSLPLCLSRIQIEDYIGDLFPIDDGGNELNDAGYGGLWWP